MVPSCGQAMDTIFYSQNTFGEISKITLGNHGSQLKDPKKSMTHQAQASPAPLPQEIVETSRGRCHALRLAPQPGSAILQILGTKSHQNTRDIHYEGFNGKINYKWYDLYRFMIYGWISQL